VRLREAFATPNTTQHELAAYSFSKFACHSLPGANVGVEAGSGAAAPLFRPGGTALSNLLLSALD
jgi:hypothetical protein